MSSSCKTDVVIFCWGEPSEAGRSAAKIVTFLGAEAKLVSMETARPTDVVSLRKLVPQCSCLVVDVETLARAADATGLGLGALFKLTSDIAKHVFIYGAQPTARHSAVLRHLSSSALFGVGPQTLASARFRVAEGHREWCGPFSGLEVSSAAGATFDHCFVRGLEGSALDTLISAADAPFFVRTQHDGSQLFFSGSREVADLDEPVSRPARALSRFSKLLPLMMFLRGALGRRIWHNENPRACFIIDDPLLKQDRYGFLEYSRLIEVTRRHGFSTSIAFIPWNYRRTNVEIAALLALNPHSAPSICVHGCDHIDEEFETSDFDSLRGRAQIALERMTEHRRLSGVPFDDVMVFPRGRFSSEAVAALKAAGYLATVNGDVFPGNMRHTLVLRDLLTVAVTRFSEFPLFGRRYPRDLAEFALDLFVGRPAMAVEHHGYFQNGYDALVTFVERLNGLEPELEWTNLSTICARASLTRNADDGSVQVQFYTDRFSIENPEAHNRTYTLFRPYSQKTAAPLVTVNGRECDFEREGDGLRISVSLSAGEAAEIKVLSRVASDEPAPSRTTRLQDAKVRARRLIGEFRDNYVDTTQGLFSRLGAGAANQRSGKSTSGADVAPPVGRSH